MKKYSKPSIKFAAFKNRTKTSMELNNSGLGINASKMDTMSFKVKPLPDKTN